MCIDIEPELRLSEKAKLSLANMFEFFDLVTITTANSYYILTEEPRFNKKLKCFFGTDLTSSEEVRVNLNEIQNIKMKGRHCYNNEGIRVDL